MADTVDTLDVLLAIGYLVMAYLLGSVPTGLIVGRVWGKRDVRSIGSGSTGATNVQRLLGMKAFAFVIAVDVAKGASVVVAALFLPLHEEVIPYVVGLSALLVTIGQCWPAWADFMGGKGAATLAGATIALYYEFWWITLVVFVALMVKIYLIRVVSIVSLIGLFQAVMLGILLVVLDELPAPYLLGVLGGAAVMIFRHRVNIRRIFLRQEREIDLRWGKR